MFEPAIILDISPFITLSALDSLFGFFGIIDRFSKELKFSFEIDEITEVLRDGHWWYIWRVSAEFHARKERAKSISRAAAIDLIHDRRIAKDTLGVDDVALKAAHPVDKCCD